MVKLFQKVTLNQFNNLNYVEILASLFLSEKGKIYITKSNFLYRSVRVGTGSSKENHTINLVKKQADYTDINFLRIAFDEGWLISYHQIAFTLYRFNTSIYLFLRKLFNLVK